MRDKTDSTAPQNSEHTRPFFARFLEGQDTSKGPAHTLKYPSDLDEWDQRLEYTSTTTGESNE
jgi:Serine endopeptidase inhibitors